jgi:hypothetical protein
MGKSLLREVSRLRNDKQGVRNDLLRMKCKNCGDQFTPGKWKRVGKSWMHNCWGTGKFYLAWGEDK